MNQMEAERCFKCNFELENRQKAAHTSGAIHFTDRTETVCVAKQMKSVKKHQSDYVKHGVDKKY